MSPDARPDRHALLELQALLIQIGALRAEGSADRFTTDDRYRWVLHRLWIAAGNEALAYTQATGQPVRADRNWANLYDLRNHLAHSRLPDIDESLVRRFTWTRLDALRATTQDRLKARPLPGPRTRPEQPGRCTRRAVFPGYRSRMRPPAAESPPCRYPE